MDMAKMLAIAIPFVAWFSVGMVGLQSAKAGSWFVTSMGYGVVVGAVFVAGAARFLGRVPWIEAVDYFSRMLVGWFLGHGEFQGATNFLGLSWGWAALFVLPAFAWILLTVWIVWIKVRKAPRPVQTS
jgi:hypothetical protein